MGGWRYKGGGARNRNANKQQSPTKHANIMGVLVFLISLEFYLQIVDASRDKSCWFDCKAESTGLATFGAQADVWWRGAVTFRDKLFVCGSMNSMLYDPITNTCVSSFTVSK